VDYFWEILVFLEKGWNSLGGLSIFIVTQTDRSVSLTNSEYRRQNKEITTKLFFCIFCDLIRLYSENMLNLNQKMGHFGKYGYLDR
jgi:hypothetical protein